MELREMCQIKINEKLVPPFSLVTCWTDDLNFAILGSESSSKFLRLRTTTHGFNEDFNLEWNSIKAPDRRPPIHFENSNLVPVYEGSSIEERQIMLLDPRIASEYSIQPMTPQIINIGWPSNSGMAEMPLAVITNYGICEILTKNPVEPVYDVCRIEINSLLKYIIKPVLNKHSFKSAKELGDYLDKYHITACSWIKGFEGNSGSLIVSTKSGYLILFRITEWTADFICKIRTNLENISMMRCSFEQMTDAKYFLFATNPQGKLAMFTVYTDSIKFFSFLWEKQDKIKFKCLQFNLNYDNNEIIVAGIKGSHFLAFRLSTEGTLLTKVHYQTSAIIFTGLQAINPLEYVTSSIEGRIEHLTLKGDVVQVELIANDLPAQNNQVLGMVATPNRVGWLFLLYGNKPLTRNHYWTLSVCDAAFCNPLDILETTNICNMESFVDCLEMLRLRIIKSGEQRNYTLTSVGYNEQCLHELRIKLHILTTLENIRVKCNHVDWENLQEERDNTRIVIEVISVYLRLDRLLVHGELSPIVQRMGYTLMSCLQRFMSEHLTSYYEGVRDQLRKDTICMIRRCEGVFNSIASENCIYCGEPVDGVTLVCKNNNSCPRCCLTLFQIPLTAECYKCNQCGNLANKDDQLLSYIIPDLNMFQCPLCLLPLTKVDCEP